MLENRSVALSASRVASLEREIAFVSVPRTSGSDDEAAHWFAALAIADPNVALQVRNRNPDEGRKLIERRIARLRDQEAAIERAKIKPSQIVHNLPKTLPYGVPSKIVASVGSHDIKQAYARVQKGTGPAVKAVANLSPQVRAELQGPEPDVTIQKLGPEVKGVGPVSNSTWEWNVTPNTLGPIKLTLAFYNVVKIDGEASETDGPVYESTFTVQASPWDRVLYYLRQVKPFYLIIAGIITAIGGSLMWIKNYFDKKYRAQEEPPARATAPMPSPAEPAPSDKPKRASRKKKADTPPA